jgi:hypothetical protein
MIKIIIFAKWTKWLEYWYLCFVDGTLLKWEAHTNFKDHSWPFTVFSPKCQQVNLQKTRLIAQMNFLANSLWTFQFQGDCCKWAYYTYGPYCIWHKLPRLPHESFVYSIQLFASRVVDDWWYQTRCASSCENCVSNVHH